MSLYLESIFCIAVGPQAIRGVFAGAVGVEVDTAVVVEDPRAEPKKVVVETETKAILDCFVFSVLLEVNYRCMLSSGM